MESVNPVCASLYRRKTTEMWIEKRISISLMKFKCLTRSDTFMFMCQQWRRSTTLLLEFRLLYAERICICVCVCDEMFELLKTGSEREKKRKTEKCGFYLLCWKEWTFELNAYTFCGSSFGWRRQSERCARACMHAKRQDEMMRHNGLNALTHILNSCHRIVFQSG